MINNDLAVSEENAELQHGIENLQSTINVVIPEHIPERVERIKFLSNRQYSDAAEQGLLLLSIKADTNHGLFSQSLDECGIHPRSARRSMAIAKMLIAMPQNKTDMLSVLNFPQNKLTELTKVPIEILNQLDADDFQFLAETSGKAFQERLQDLTCRVTELEDDNAHNINELERERMRKKPDVRFDLPVFIAQCRSDAIAYTEMMDDALSQSIAQTTELIEKRSLDFDSRLAAAQTMHHCWASMYMQIGNMLDRLHGEFGEQMQGIENLPRFDEAEWEYVDSERGRMLESFQAFHRSKKGAN